MYLQRYWKFILDVVINILFRPPPDTAVRKDNVLFIRYRYGGNEYIVTLPFREEIYHLAPFVEATLDGIDVSQQPGVPYCRKIPYEFEIDEDLEIDHDILLV